MGTTVPVQPANPPGRPRARARARLGRALTVLAAAAAALAGWAVAVPLAGAGLAVRGGPAGAVQHIGAAPVAAVALLAGLAGWALLAVLERFTSHARGAWTAIALAALAVSLAGPLSARTPAAMAALASLHLVVGAVLITGLPRPAWRPVRSLRPVWPSSKVAGVSDQALHRPPGDGNADVPARQW